MLVQSQESRVLFDEYHKVFGNIDRENTEQLRLEKKAMHIMNLLQRMNHEGKKIEKEGKRDKIENFNKRYMSLYLELHSIFEKSYAK